MRAGVTMNIALNPLGVRQLREEEVVYPGNLILRNGVRTDAGNYKVRPGFETTWSLGVEQPVNLLIPKVRYTNSIGFAVTPVGTVYELHSDRTSTLLTGPTLNGDYRPTWCEFDGTVIICDGQAPIQTDAGTTMSLLGGSPPAAKFCAVIADRVVLSGYDDTGFQWSDPGTATTWPVQNVSSVTGNGEKIRYMTVVNTDLYFFKDASIEVWAHIGGTEVFGRRGIITIMDKFSRNRGIAGFSVVQGDDGFYFYADGDFWKFTGFQAQRISQAYKRELGRLEEVEHMYGFHFAQEHLIRWFEPVSARCFTYDYVNNVFSEDSTWSNGEHGRLPIYAYAEFQGVPYVGDYNPTGIISRWQDDLYSDNGTPIHVERTVRIPFKDGRQGRVNRLRLRMKRGSGGDSTTTETLQVRWAFDEGDWTPYSTVTIGDNGDRDPYVDVTEPNGTSSLGVGRELKLQIIQAATVPHLLTHALLTVNPLGN